MASGGPLVPFLEVNLFEGKDLPALNKMNPGSDPYVILYLASKPKDRHKSKIFKQEVNPKVSVIFNGISDQICKWCYRSLILY
jgi:hypothetical protein